MSVPKHYDCHEALRALDSYVDRELSQADLDAVQAHLDACENCARDFRFEASLIQQIKAKVRRIQAPEGFLERMARLLGEG